MWVSDSMGNNIGWQQMGTWDFPGATPNLVPVNTAVSPSSGSGGAQMFTVTVSDGNGEQDIAHTQLTINDTQDVANACSIFYNRLANWVGLYNDAGTAWTNATLGSAVTLSNSFCSLEVAGVTETVSGNDLMVSFPIVFSGAVLGAQNVYLLTRDKSGFEAGWDSMGTWTVTAHSSTPAVLAIAPNSGNVTSATFTAIYVDGTGAADMSWSYVMFNQVVDWAGSCGVRYNLADNLVYVVNDAGSGWTTGQAPGTATTLSNSTCDLDVSGVTVDQTGLVLTVTYPLTFTTSFSATRNIKMYASDSTANSGWQQMGTWDFPGGTPNEVPVNGTLSPSSGSGGSQTFTVTGSDGNGGRWCMNRCRLPR